MNASKTWKMGVNVSRERNKRHSTPLDDGVGSRVGVGGLSVEGGGGVAQTSTPFLVNLTGRTIHE